MCCGDGGAVVMVAAGRWSADLRKIDDRRRWWWIRV